MSLTLIVMTDRGHGPPLRDFAALEPRMEDMVTVRSGPELVAALHAIEHRCVVIDGPIAGETSEPTLDCIDLILRIDPDATIVLSVAPGDHGLGIKAIRSGAQDYVERAADGSLAVPALVRALTTSIERLTRVIGTHREHRRMAKVLEHAGEGYLVVNPNGMVLATSPSLSRIWPDGFEHVPTIFEWLHPDDREMARGLGVEAIANPGWPVVGEVRAVDSAGVVRWFEIRVNDQSADPAIAGLITNVRDITDRVLSELGQSESESARAHQALHDSLTDLPNRALLEQHLDAALESDDRPPVILFIDIDNFKVINEGLGHSVGDQIIVELARRLKANIRSDDTAARFGGDEFAVLLRDLPDSHAAVARAEHLREVLSTPARLDGVTHFVSVSIGVARGSDNASAETMLRDADAAMYQAKALGRERVMLFQPSFHAKAEHRLRTGTKMRHALEDGHFHVAYQPFISVADEQVIGMEALLRWNDPETGSISPAEFIPVAEQTGMIVQLGAWALDEALAQLRTWCDNRPWGSQLALSVNLSARQLSVDGLFDSVRQSIIDTGVDAGALCLEITETAVMADIEASIGLMRMMRSLGVDISIDDFGTGYSSLNYLKSLPLTTLKVDRSFIDGLGSDPHDTSIVEAVVALGHALGMRVHAEGVERPDQLAELRRIGCDDAQGWLWAPAMAAADFEAWMDSRS